MYLTIGTLILALAGMTAHRILGRRSGPGPAAVSGVGSRNRNEAKGVPSGERGRIGIRDIMMIVVTALVLVSGLYVILSKNYDDATQKWAFASIGAVIGFWLNQERA